MSDSEVYYVSLWPVQGCESIDFIFDPSLHICMFLFTFLFRVPLDTPLDLLKVEFVASSGDQTEYGIH